MQDRLSGAEIRRLMRVNRKTIRGVAAAWNLTQVRVRYVRAHGVVGAAFVQDWLAIVGAAA